MRAEPPDSVRPTPAAAWPLHFSNNSCRELRRRTRPSPRGRARRAPRTRPGSTRCRPGARPATSRLRLHQRRELGVAVQRAAGVGVVAEVVLQRRELRRDQPAFELLARLRSGSRAPRGRGRGGCSRCATDCTPGRNHGCSSSDRRAAASASSSRSANSYTLDRSMHGHGRSGADRLGAVEPAARRGRSRAAGPAMNAGQREPVGVQVRRRVGPVRVLAHELPGRERAEPLHAVAGVVVDRLRVAPGWRGTRAGAAGGRASGRRAGSPAARRSAAPACRSTAHAGRPPSRRRTPGGRAPGCTARESRVKSAGAMSMPLSNQNRGMGKRASLREGEGESK